MIEANRYYSPFENHSSTPPVIGRLLAKEPDFVTIDDLVPEQYDGRPIEGFIERVRSSGGISFIALRSGLSGRSLQITIETPSPEEREGFKSLELRKGAYTRFTGNLLPRPAENVREEETARNPLAQVELKTELSNIRVVAKPEMQPAGIKWADVKRSGFKPEHYGEIIRLPEFLRTQELRRALKGVFLDHFIQKGFVHIEVPALTGSISENGAEQFVVQGRSGNLSLIQSPQQLKQIWAGILGKPVVCSGSAFRNDPSDTPYHLSEFGFLDIETPVVHEDKWQATQDVMLHLQDVVMVMVEEMLNHTQCLAENNMAIPAFPSDGFPTLSFHDALTIAGARDELNRAGENKVGQYVKDQTGSDFYFVFGYPRKQKPFYTDYDVSDDEGSTFDDQPSLSFDLMFRGVEITSGGLRIANPAQLERRLIEQGQNLAQFRDYLDHFKRGTPQTGGFGLGAERILTQALNISARLATIYPKTAQVILG